MSAFSTASIVSCIFLDCPDSYRNLQIVSDENRISQVISNLVGNALKYSLVSPEEMLRIWPEFPM